MGDFVATFILLFMVATCASVFLDLFNYEDRQAKWEKEHPGATYMRGYRKLERKTDKARKKMGEV